MKRRLFLQILLTLPALSQPIDFRQPRRSYKRVTYLGRTYLVEKPLTEASQPAVARLDKNIRKALGVLPFHCRAELAALPIYILTGPTSPGGGRSNGLEYFHLQAPEHRPTLDPAWSDCIVSYCAQNYTQISELWALKAVVHEFAHAYQLHHHPEEQPDIMAAWHNALDRGLYLKVVDEQGLSHARAYALINQLEYFAELSCMYFARCNYPPADRAALRSYDPEGYAMVEKIWRLA